MEEIRTVGKRSVQIFKMKNRRGYAAVCDGHLTEGDTSEQAFDRMVKALDRTARLGGKD